jgi:hypothetical protein
MSSTSSSPIQAKVSHYKQYKLQEVPVPLDNDGDLFENEDWVDGVDNDGDGLVDEDPEDYQPLRGASEGFIRLYDPDLQKVGEWTIPSLPCIEHNANDGLQTSTEGLQHSLFIKVPVALMPKEDGDDRRYRFVISTQDSHGDREKGHRNKWALERNAAAPKPAYVSDVDDGWLQVKLEPSGEIVSLPYTLKVRRNKKQGGRDYFTILEGRYKNQKASVSRKTGGGSYLVDGSIHRPAIRLTYSKGSGILKIVGSDETYNAIHDPPLPNGTYDIEIPDAPHGNVDQYLDRARRAKTWFPILNQSGRYFHTGSRTAGCLTVTDIDKWDSLYDKVIKRRKDDKSVGTVQVTD